MINDVFAYGWNSADISQVTGVSAADLTTGLGHMTAAQAGAVAGAVLVTGANAPKPMRVTRKLANAPVGRRASLSTWCGYDKLASAIAIGFSLSKPARPISLGAEAGSRTVPGVVTLSNGLKYVQPIERALTQDATLMADLGIELDAGITAADRKKLARGTRSKPGMVQVGLGNGLSASLPFSTDQLTQAEAAGRITRLEFAEFPAGVAPGP